MARQLQILAIEPYFGGVRRTMLEALQRTSRHRWTLLKLPPRRLERRLSTAAVWFAEVLNRNGFSRSDVLVASDTLSLGDLYANLPDLRRIPSVLYSHDNQLPAEDEPSTPLAIANLNSAIVADEAWFNSVYHLRTFLAKAGHLIGLQRGSDDRNHLAEISAKAQVVAPPIPTQDLYRLAERKKLTRIDRRILIDMRDADAELAARALQTLALRHEMFTVDAIGAADGLTQRVPVRQIDADDESAVSEAIVTADVYLSTKIGSPFDDLAVRMLSTGGQVLLPQDAAYSELLPPSVHSSALHDHSAETIVARIQDAWHLPRDGGHEFSQQAMLKRFDPATAARVFDLKLEQLAVSRFLDEEPEPHGRSPASHKER